MSYFKICYILLLSFVITVSGLQYKCHRDICDSSWQFCNDGEERCDVCTPEQCQPDVADHIFHQCEEKCRSWKTTTVGSNTDPTQVTTQATVPNLWSEGLPVSVALGIILATTVVLAVIIIVCFVNVNKRLQQILAQQRDIESGLSSSTLSSTVEYTGETEKRPLLDTGNPHPHDSNFHHNKLTDIQTLAQATHATQEVQASAPPSYSTNDTHKPSIVKQVSSNQDFHSEKLSDTDFIGDNMRPQTAEDITRLKSV